MAAKKKKGPSGPPPIAVNRRARFDYEILETVEAGLVLRGSEVKTLRNGKVSLDEAFCRVFGDEIWLVGCHIPEYTAASWANHDPVRKRKLLLHKREIRRLKARLEQKGLTLVPTRMYWSPSGTAKVQIGVAKGKKKHDKRESLRKRDDQRLMREV